MLSVSHKNKAVFWHIHKTGGTYIDFILQEYYDFKLKDVDLKLLMEKMQNTTCNCNQSVHEEDINTEDANEEDANEEYVNAENTKQISKAYFLENCIKNQNIILNMNEEKWRTYFKFAFIRNPYDRAISSYEFLRDKDYDKRVDPEMQSDNCTFKDFYVNYEKYNTNIFMYCHAFQSQYENMSIEMNEMQIDYLAKFENLNEELIHILKQLGIEDCTKHLEFVYENFKINESVKKDITSYYCNDTLAAINALFSDDFEKLGFVMYNNVEDLNNYLLEYNSKTSQENKNKEILIKFGFLNKTTESSFD
jgi:hypothetical protein